MKPRYILLFAIIALLLPVFALAAPVVTDVTAKQRYPWNGKVDITCTVSGISGSDGGLKFSVLAVNPDSGKTNSVSHVKVVRGGTESDYPSVSSNGNYRLVWDATADLGEVLFTNMVVIVEMVERKIQLWEGGPYWAETNIGADAPEEYGLYFWWGDTIGYRREGDTWVANDGLSQGFSFSSENALTSGKGNETLQSEGWITEDRVLISERDAAHVHWGGSWRIPTNSEISELNSNCDWTWTTMNGVSGYRICGRNDYSNVSIFIPASGEGEGNSLGYAGSNGNYWSSVPYPGYNGNFAMSLYFYSGNHQIGYYNHYRYTGRAIRPVQVFAE